MTNISKTLKATELKLGRQLAHGEMLKKSCYITKVWRTFIAVLRFSGQHAIMYMKKLFKCGLYVLSDVAERKGAAAAAFRSKSWEPAAAAESKQQA